MQVIDEVTKRTVNYSSCKRVIVKFSEEGEIIYGYTRQWKERCIPITTRSKDGKKERAYILDTPENKDQLFFSNNSGTMMSKVNLDRKTYLQEKFIYGQGKFPYSFDRRYEAVESFDIFKGRQQILEMKKYVLADYMPYTFGLEFETSAGIIEENLCVRDGLIPLRDGSITGIEYSTVVMQGNEGLSLLEQQLNTLKSRTAFNKECSLHIHFGGFPLNTEKIFRVYSLCRLFQNEIRTLVPELTFNTSAYKSSGKDYCKLFPDQQFRDFNQLYQGLVGRNYLGSLTQPHPNDVDRSRKWQINTRYFWVNFINAICYTVNKTIEFRLLRPTYNKGKIITWMYIMNAILRYAETDLPLRYDPKVHGIPSESECRRMPVGDYGNEIIMVNNRTGVMRSATSGETLFLDDVLKVVYPKDVFEILDCNIQKLMIIAINQRNSGDKVGANLMFEDELFNEKENTVF